MINLETSSSVQKVVVEDVDPRVGGKVDKVITSINGSLRDDSWNVDTRLIIRKYINHPENYQVFKVAKIFDESVGYIIIRKDLRGNRSSYLSYVVTDLNHQKKGIGTALLETAVKEIQRMGMTALILDCEPENCSFYRKFAQAKCFSISEERIGSYAFGADKIQMTITFPSCDSFTRPAC
ncbi:MAG: GNAT family N-acetyltransferase [Chlamydiia bacterium]|nr:GNAT family N-acetyltransferase [Chlamydiia bacterium]